MTRRGDNIPSVDEYAHWNEDAQFMWYQENKYDMEHADEELDDPYDDYDYDYGEDDEGDFGDQHASEYEVETEMETRE